MLIIYFYFNFSKLPFSFHLEGNKFSPNPCRDNLTCHYTCLYSCEQEFNIVQARHLLLGPITRAKENEGCTTSVCSHDTRSSWSMSGNQELENQGSSVNYKFIATTNFYLSKNFNFFKMNPTLDQWRMQMPFESNLLWVI